MWLSDGLDHNPGNADPFKYIKYRFFLNIGTFCKESFNVKI